MLCTYRIQLLFLFSIIAFLYIILVIQYNIWRLDEDEAHFVKAKNSKRTHSVKKTVSVQELITKTTGNNIKGQGTSRKLHRYHVLYWQKKDTFPKENPHQSCLYQNCRISQDEQEIDTADAVVMTMETLTNRGAAAKFPSYRHPKQIWILFTMDPLSQMTKLQIEEYSRLFNATATYSETSDIFVPLVEVVLEKQHNLHAREGSITKVNYAQGKTKLVVTYMDHCTSQSERERYISALQNYLHVDIYGKCGNVQCQGKDTKRSKDQTSITEESCFTTATKSYKFYLAFEDSLCEDYVSKTLWLPLHYGIIPVVLGTANYSKTLPPHSYIDVRDFKSPEELAGFLNVLNQHSTLYNAYFIWKRYHRVKYWRDGDTLGCRLCEYMNKNYGRVINKEKRLVSDFWNQSKHCLDAKKFYKDVLTP